MFYRVNTWIETAAYVLVLDVDFTTNVPKYFRNFLYLEGVPEVNVLIT